MLNDHVLKHHFGIMLATVLFVLFSFLLVWVAWIVTHRKLTNLPPGPIPWPFFGNSLQLDKFFVNSLTEFGRKYGPISSFYIGHDPIVVLNSPEAVQEVLESNDKISRGRELIPFAHEFAFDKGAAFNNTNTWEPSRKVTAYGLLRHLKNFISPSLEKELQKLVEATKKSIAQENIGKGSFLHSLQENSFHYGWRIQCGGSCPEEQVVHRSKKVWEALDAFAVALSPSNTTMSKFPLVKYFYPYSAPGKSLRSIMAGMTKIFSEAYDEHIETFKGTGGKEKDLMDYAISVQEELGLKKENVVQLVLESFLAGAESSATTITWVLMYLSSYPDVNYKVQKELEHVVGSSGSPKNEHLEKLAYLDCVIREVLRIRTVLPIGFPRKALGDIKLKSGYVIPEGTVIMTNSWGLCHDESLWKNPDEFNPDRFLNEEAEVKIKGTEIRAKTDHYKFIPFGAGKRACVGYPLGKLNVKLTVAVLAWHFEWSLLKKDLTPHQKGAVLAPVHDEGLYPSAILRA
jgi:cytochrome P450